MDTPITVQGTLQSDGSLVLDEKLTLPAGRVQVTVAPLPELPANDPFWQMMQAIWSGQKARGHVPRSAEAVEAERRIMREEWDERMRRLEDIQAEARQARGLSS